MRVVFIFQDVLEIEWWFLELEENDTNAQIISQCELIKKDGKGLFVIHQCVDSIIFEKIIEEETTNGVWDTLKKLYEGD